MGLHIHGGQQRVVVATAVVDFQRIGSTPEVDLEAVGAAQVHAEGETVFVVVGGGAGLHQRKRHVVDRQRERPDDVADGVELVDDLLRREVGDRLEGTVHQLARDVGKADLAVGVVVDDLARGQVDQRVSVRRGHCHGGERLARWQRREHVVHRQQVRQLGRLGRAGDVQQAGQRVGEIVDGFDLARHRVRDLGRQPLQTVPEVVEQAVFEQQCGGGGCGPGCHRDIAVDDEGVGRQQHARLEGLDANGRWSRHRGSATTLFMRAVERMLAQAGLLLGAQAGEEVGDRDAHVGLRRCGRN